MAAVPVNMVAEVNLVGDRTAVSALFGTIVELPEVVRAGPTVLLGVFRTGVDNVDWLDGVPGLLTL